MKEKYCTNFSQNTIGLNIILLVRRKIGTLNLHHNGTNHFAILTDNTYGHDLFDILFIDTQIVRYMATPQK